MLPMIHALQIVAIDKYLTLHEWVLWLDCDSLVMNSEVTLEHVIWSALSASEQPDEVHVILSEDGTMINTGELYHSDSCVCFQSSA